MQKFVFFSQKPLPYFAVLAKVQFEKQWYLVGAEYFMWNEQFWSQKLEEG